MNAEYTQTTIVVTIIVDIGIVMRCRKPQRQPLFAQGMPLEIPVQIIKPYYSFCNIFVVVVVLYR
jgi:hypothetical protein